MIDLRIGGAEEAPGIIASGWPTKAVSLLGKKDAHRVPCQGAHHLVLFFDDTERHNDKQHGHYKSAVCVAGETALCERR